MHTLIRRTFIGICRKAWNSFKGFPKESAAAAYVYIVNQYKADISWHMSTMTGNKEPQDNGGFAGLTSPQSTLINSG
jgi:hypothetical protein